MAEKIAGNNQLELPTEDPLWQTLRHGIKLFVDDNKKCPEGWVLARTFDEAIDQLREGGIQCVSLDHDLGEEKTGYDIACWIEDNCPKLPMSVHSENPVGREKITRVIDTIARREDYIKECT